MSNRSRIGFVVVALSLVPLAELASADVVAQWAEDAPNFYKFAYKVTNLPDFDQVRTGLPGCGLNYCVPTATADLLAYIANHGFPEVSPGPGDWQSQANYAAATNAIKSFGQKMSTSASSGTGKSAWYFSLVYAPPFYTAPLVPASKFTVTGMFAHDDYRPRAYAVAKTAILNDSLIALIHGWYKPLLCAPSQPDFRDGGHCLAVQEIKGYWHKGGGSSANEYAAELKLRDPGADEGADGTGTCGGAFAPNSQSLFASSGYPLWLHSAYALSFCIDLGKFDRLQVCGNDYCDGTALYRLVDGYLMISTKSAYALTDDLEPLLIQLKPIKLTSDSPPPTVKVLANLPPIASATLSADLSEILVVAQNQVQVFDPLAGGLSPLPEGDYVITDPNQVVVGRHRGLYVLDGSNVFCIELDGQVPVMVAQVQPPFPIDAMVYDDEADELVLLSLSAQKLLRYPWQLNGPPHILNLPPNLPFLPAVQMKINPADGSLWIAQGTESFFDIMADPDGNLTAMTFALPPGLGNIVGFDVFDDGNLLVSLGAGELHEFELTNGALTEVAGSPFAGLPGGPFVLATHSRTNFTAGVHDTPEWNDVFPPAFAPSVDVCTGDLNGDGAVDGADLGSLLAEWGSTGAGLEADLTGDNQVDGADLGVLLAAWGPCPEIVETTLLNQDDCQVASLVTEGSYPFDTTLATTDGPALPTDCDEGFGLSLENDVWAEYLPSQDGLVKVSTCGTADFDTRLAAYVGFCDALIGVGCNDDGPGCPGLTSSMSFLVSAAVPVKLRIGGYGGAIGTGTLAIDLLPTITADNCVDAVPVGDGYYPFDTTNATTDGPPLPAGCEEGSGLEFGQDVWILYTPAATGVATVTTCGLANFDTRLAAYSGACGGLALLACNDDASGCAGFTSTMTVPVVQNVPIRIRIGGYGAASGTGVIAIFVQ